MAVKRKLTKREKKVKAGVKKQMQEEGILPPDKPRLNREKFIREASKEWDTRNNECMIWDIYLIRAVVWMTGHVERNGRRSLQAVGAAKALKIAVRLEKFHHKLKDEGRTEYKLEEEFRYIRDIIDA